VPPVPGGLVPSVSLDYSSGLVDGQSAGQNVQPSVVGEGWTYPGESYIERTYRPCHDDSENSPHWTSLNDEKVLCWRLPNAQIVLNGKSSEIVLGSDGTWRLADDDGEKVQLLTGADNRDNDGEHWKITTVDGTQYWFGRHWLPNGRGETFSTAEVRVYANHSGEPCFSTVSIGSTRCDQAYRWMLDYVVDRHGNEMSFYYLSGTNRAADTGSGSYEYRRTIRLSRIEYGTRAGDDPQVPAPARVLFTVADRCLADCYDSGGGEKVANWPDTPFDLECTVSPCVNNESPSFWARTRLSKIRTQVWETTGWRTVDEFDLTHKFPDTANNLSPVLWLDFIARTGYAPDGTPQVFPKVGFDGERRSHRADYDPQASMADPRRWRVVEIDTETGGRIEVVYFGPHVGCQFGQAFPDPHSNTARCFPRLYTNSFNETGWSWWHLFTVQQVIETDLVGGSPPVVHAYSYASAGSTTVKWAHDDGSAVWGSSMPYRSWSNWRGWARVTVKTGTTAAGPRSQVATTYFRGLHGDLADSSGATRSVSVTDVHDSTWIDYPYKAGQVMQQVTHDTAEGDPVQVTRFRYERHITGTRTLSTDWAIPNVHTSVIGRTQAQERWDWDPAAGVWTRFEGIRWRWDAGNGRLDSTSDVFHDTCVRYEYADNTSLRLLDRVSRATTNVNTCDLAAGALLADERYFYDGQATHGATPTVGDVTQTQVYDGTGWFTVSQAEYDGYGRVISSLDGLGRETTTGYIHNTDRQLVETQVTNPAGHVTTTVLEPGRGLPVEVTDPNGKTTTVEYDPAGRVAAVWAPGHPTTGTPTAAYEYTLSKTAPSWVASKTLGPNGNQIISYDIFDGLLRPRQAQATAPDGNRVITDTTYDHRGQVAKTSTFYNDTSAPDSTLVTFADSAVDRQVRYVYDGQGRQTEQQQWSQDAMLFTHTTTYGYRNILSVPPTGGTVTRELFNELGLTTAQRKYHTVNPTGSYDETSYTYDWLDRLVTVSDPGANTWTYTYDMAGRLVQTTDPDAGTTTTVFDNAGQKTEITDARGVTLAYDYDLLGRTTGVYQDNLAGTLLAEWEYDTVQLGQLTSSTRYDGGLAYVREVTGYDDAYRPTATKVTIPTSTPNGQLAGTYQEDMTYHVDGSIATRSLPAAGGFLAETLTHTYTNTGLLDTMTGDDDYLAGITYRWDGTIAETLHGQDDQQVRLSYAYEEATGRLETSQIDTEDPLDPGTFIDGFTTTHTYDDAGNILAAAGRTGGTVDQVECFDYDHLRRLVEAWTQNTEGCGTPQATGADPYHRTWIFDPVGNRLTQTDHDTTAGNTVWTYDVGATHNVTAHQVAEVTATGPKAATASRVFDYDQAGNTTTHTTETGTTQTLTWSLQGHLETLTEGTDVTTYVYDADGNRIITRTPQATILYLGSTQIEELSGGAVVATRYYDNTAVRTPTGLVWTATDRNQTSVVQIDATTLQAERRRLLPYGEPRGTPPSSWAGDKGYVGGTTDPTGLTHLGARYYDPSLGRFTSLDPIIAHGDTQQTHGYTYANNNPILYSDPTGLFAGCTPDGYNFCPGYDVRQQPVITTTSSTRNDVARRDPDERDGRRIRNDERSGRQAGGAGNGHFDNDWAGRAILERYLRGGGDWAILHDPNWSRYMMANERLRRSLADRVEEQAQLALFASLTGEGGQRIFTERFHAEVENGEGIVGYQYLHGTDQEAGDFQFRGTTAVTAKSDGTYEVTVAGRYIWNDNIDPNFQYSTDRWKSRLAEIITLGQADPYSIKITWSSATTVTLDHQGNVLSIKGYPAS
jgi:RHS repeat-associated protein